MKLTTQDFFSDHKVIETIGLVTGNSVKKHNIIFDFLNEVREVFGGEIRNYSELWNEVRQDALKKMIHHAHEKKADGIVAIRFAITSLRNHTTEALVTGTAVKLELI